MRTRHNVQVTGPAQGQPMLFAHGFGCDQNMWRHVSPHFEDRFQVVLFHCTVVVMRLRRRERAWTATMSVGGHPLPLLHRGPLGPAPIGRPGTLIGLLGDPRLHEGEVALEAGDTVLLYTDGLTEARHDDGFSGEERLFSSMHRHVGGTARDVTEGVLHDVLEYEGSRTSDDIALVALRVP